MKPLALLLAAALALAACGDDDADQVAEPSGDTSSEPSSEPVTLRLVTHDSFVVSDSVFDAFEADTGISVELLQSGDAGSVLNQAILTKDDPQGDVLFGVDNTSLARALDEDLFLPHEASRLDDIDPALVLDPEHRVTPVDTGDVCLNYDKAALEAAGLAAPASLDDLLDPAYDGALVVENPATSSPGSAFLLATIAEFGEDGWQDYWAGLRDNGVEVVAGWEEAYYGSFTRGGGEQPIVVSYATSPVAEVVFSEVPLEEAPTGVVLDSCYRQIEFAGVLAGTAHEAEAGQLVDFLLSDTFQADIPLNMFVYPVVDVELPEAFVTHGEVATDPLALDPALVAEHRDGWIEEWTDIVLR